MDLNDIPESPIETVDLNGTFDIAICDLNLKDFIKAMEATEIGKRDYIGASAIGTECTRQLWYTNNGYDPQKITDSRRKRVFNMGHLVEFMMKAEMRVAGFEIEDGGKFDVPEHNFKGHCDGVLRFSPIETIEVPCLLEIKSMNTTRFKKLVKEGIRLSNASYWIQSQVYMKYICNENPMMFVAMDKNTCEIYCELIKFEPKINYIIEQRLAIANDFEIPDPPENLSWHCSFCDFSNICDKKKELRRYAK